MSANKITRSEAYETGYEAHEQQEGRTANPYGRGTWEHAQWDEGWASASGETYGDLHDYATAEWIRAATRDERDASREAAESDGGAGVIDVDGRSCYVEE